MKNNLEHSALPTPDEIRLYQNGKLGPMRSHEIELLAQENPLLAEALEGFAVKPAFNMLPLIHAGVIEASSGAASGGAMGGGALLAKSTPWWHLNGWWIGVVAGTVATTGTVVVVLNSGNEVDALSSTRTQPTEQLQNEITQVESELITGDTSSFVDAQKNLDAVNSVMNNQQTEGQLSKASEIATEENRTPANGNTISSITPGGNDLKLTQETNNTGVSPNKSSTIAIGIIHVLNYKLADYTAIRQSTWQKFSLEDVGLPANFDNEDQRNKYLTENPDQAVPYVTYVSQCIKAYDENKFSLALNKFGEVLAQYPDDVNGLFYSGMSNYMLGNYATAITFFEKAEKNYIRTFNEEAMFYHAKSLKKLGQIDEASSYFVKVVRFNGFYKEHAIEELESDN